MVYYTVQYNMTGAFAVCEAYLITNADVNDSYIFRETPNKNLINIYKTI